MRHSFWIALLASALGALVLLLMLGQEPEGVGATPGAAQPSLAAEAEAGAGSLADSPRPDGMGSGRGARLLPEGGAAEQAEASAPGRLGRGRITGRLVDGTGEPIGQVLVSLVEAPLPERSRARRPRGSGPGPLGSAETQADGTFVLRSVAGDFHLEVAASGFAPLVEPFYLARGQDFDFGDLQLATGVLIAGRVVNEAGLPVEGVELFAGNPEDGGALAQLSQLGAGRMLQATGPDGRFRIASQAVGPWFLRFVHPSHPSQSLEGMTSLPGQVVDGLELRLTSGALIAGSVQGLGAGDAQGLEVLARRSSRESSDLAAFLEERRADLAEDGRFQLLGLAPGGSYHLWLHERGSQEDDSQRSEAVAARAGELDAVLVHGPGARLLWTLLDAGGEPIEHYSARLIAESSQAFGGARTLDGPWPGGRGEFAGLWPDGGSDRFRLSLASPGMETLLRSGVQLEAGQSLDLGKLRLEPGPHFRVQVTDAQSGQPVAGAEVSFEPQAPGEGGRARNAGESGGRTPRGDLGSDAGAWARDRVTSASDGVALVSASAPLAGRLLVEAAGYARGSLPGVVAPTRGPVQVGMALQRGVEVSVLVVDAAGLGVPGARVEHRGPGDLAPEPHWLGAGAQGRRTDGEGQASFAHLPPGTHHFRIADRYSGGEVGVALASLDSSETLDDSWTAAEIGPEPGQLVVLTEPQRAVLAGRVTEEGAPLVGAKITLLPQAKDGSRPELRALLAPIAATTDAAGGFRLPAVEPGPYRVSVGHASRAMDHRVLVELSAGSKPLLIDLALASVRGRVVDASGSPVAGALVRAREEADQGVRIVLAGGAGESASSLSVGDDAVAVVTAEDGGYELRGVATQVSFRVQASLAGFPSAHSAELVLDVGAERLCEDLVLHPGGRLTVLVQGADGASTSGSLLEAFFRGGGPPVSPRFEVVQGSEVILEDLQVGPWDLRVRRMGTGSGGADDAEPAFVRVEVASGGDQRVRVDA